MANTSHDSATLEHRIRSLGDWFHNLHFGDIQTAPSHPLGDYPRQKWLRFAHAVPDNLQGRSVLDIGCNAGFYSLEMKRRGADRVLGIDTDDRYLAQARFAAQTLDADIEFRNLSVYQVHTLRERFDVVLFLGVLYHLRHPLLALDLLHDHVVGNLLVFQSMLRGPRTQPLVAPDYEFWEDSIFREPGYPSLYFVERRFANDPTNWWIPNHACAAAMLRSAGFEILATPEDEVFICGRSERPAVDGL